VWLEWLEWLKNVFRAHVRGFWVRVSRSLGVCVYREMEFGFEPLQPLHPNWVFWQVTVQDSEGAIAGVQRCENCQLFQPGREVTRRTQHWRMGWCVKTSELPYAGQERAAQ